jgi:hypothetical protein
MDCGVLGGGNRGPADGGVPAERRWRRPRGCAGPRRRRAGRRRRRTGSGFLGGGVRDWWQPRVPFVRRSWPRGLKQLFRSLNSD